MTLSKTAAYLALGLFLALMLWAWSTGAPINLDAFTQDAWVTVGLGDLMIGFLLISIVIFVVEPVKWKALCWCAPMFIIGNGVGALWLILNIDRIRDRLAPR